MTALQLNLLRDLLQSREYYISILIGRTYQRVTGIKFNPTGARIITEVGEVDSNRYTCDKVRVQKKIWYNLFSPSGEPRILTFQGIKWAIIPIKEVKPGDMGFNTQSEDFELILDINVQEELFKSYTSGKTYIRKFKEELLAIRPLIPLNFPKKE